MDSETAELPGAQPSGALRNWLNRRGVVADNADPEPVPGEVPSAQALPNADHIFPGEPPSERLYSRGCRCAACTAEHNAQTRRRYHEHKNGTFRDRRQKTPTGDPLLADLLALAQHDLPLRELLKRHGHAVAQVAGGEAVPAAEPQTWASEGTSTPRDSQWRTDAHRDMEAATSTGSRSSGSFWLGKI